MDLRDELDDYTVTFTSLVEDIDATPFMKGLPDDLEEREWELHLVQGIRQPR